MSRQSQVQGVLAQLPELLVQEEERIREAQERARDMGRDLYLAGMSWADIGRLLGVSRQAARQRFGPAVDAWRAAAGDVLPWEAWDGGVVGQLLDEAFVGGW